MVEPKQVGFTHRFGEGLMVKQPVTLAAINPCQFTSRAVISDFYSCAYLYE